MLTQYRERSDWRAYLEILLSLATISIFSVFALRPTLLTIAELVKEIEEKDKTLKTMDNKIQNLGKAQSLYDQQIGNIQLLENHAIPKSPNADIFARQIEGLSNSHNVRISSISLGKAVILGEQPKMSNQDQADDQKKTDETFPEGASSLSFSVNGEIEIGQYAFLTTFLSEFERLRMPAKIDSFNLKLKEEEQEQQKILTLIIEGRLPYLKIENKINQ